MPADNWSERATYAMDNPPELRRLEGLLYDAVNGSGDLAAVSASSRLLAQQLIEAGPEMEVAAYRHQLEVSTTDLVQHLIGRLDVSLEELPGRAAEPPPCQADTEAAFALEGVAEASAEKIQGEWEERERLDSILAAEVPVVRASGYGGYQATAGALNGFVRWVHQNDLGPIRDARDVARACRDGNPKGLEAYYCEQLR